MLWLENAIFQQGGFPLSANLKIEAGGITAVIGPSGAGKSTLMGGIAGFHPQTAGRLLWQDTDMTELAPAQRPVSMLFQDNNLFPHLTVMQNVALALEPKLKPSASARDAVQSMLEQVGLSGLSDRKPAELSGGQQSRAALARALLQNRDVMLMDEPFSALGPALKAEMLDLSVGLAKDGGRTVIMVTHDPSDAARIAETIIGVAEGRAWSPMPAGEFLSNPPDVFASYLG